MNNRKRLSLFLLLGLLLAESVCLLFSFIPENKLRALAVFPNDYFFKLASNVTTFSPNFQNLTNTWGIQVNVKVYLQTVANESFLQEFILAANGTTFIVIEGGATTQSQNIFWNLQPQETLSYNASATPISAIDVGDSALISYMIEVYEAIPIIIPPPIIVSHVFDVNISHLPLCVTYIFIFCQTFDATVLITNKGPATDATLTYMLLDTTGKSVFEATLTLFFKTSEEKTLTLSIPIPCVSGTYALKVQIEKPTIAVASKTLDVVLISPFLIMAVFIIIAFIVLFLILRRTKRV